MYSKATFRDPRSPDEFACVWPFKNRPNKDAKRSLEPLWSKNVVGTNCPLEQNCSWSENVAADCPLEQRCHCSKDSFGTKMFWSELSAPSQKYCAANVKPNKARFFFGWERKSSRICAWNWINWSLEPNSSCMDWNRTRNEKNINGMTDSIRRKSCKNTNFARALGAGVVVIVKLELLRLRSWTSGNLSIQPWANLRKINRREGRKTARKEKKRKKKNEQKKTFRRARLTATKTPIRSANCFNSTGATCYLRQRISLNPPWQFFYI